MATRAVQRRLLLDSIIFDLQRGGGISRYWFELLSNLIRRRPDWQPVILVNPHADNSLLRQLLELIERSPWAESHQLDLPLLGRYRSQVTRRFGNIGMWHSSYYRVPAEPMPVVTTVHDFTYERYGSPLQARVHRWQKRKAIRSSSRVVCVSGATLKDLLAFYPDVPAERCHVVHHGLSDAFRASDERASAPAAGDYVLFVGQRGSYKNFGLAVAAASAIAGMHLFIAGGGALSPAETAMLERELPGRYRYFAQVTDEVLRDLYRSAVALTYLSSYEGFGLPPLEAMACGCPVIAMNTSSVPEVMAGAGILLNDAEPRAVVEAISAVRDPDYRQALIDAGLRRAAQFSWDRAVDETLAVYELAAQTSQ